MGLQLRLGSVQCPAGAVCQIMKAGQSETEKCLQTLDSPLTHPHLCKCGPARLRPHRSLMRS
eukprot:11933487-Karenia_brevis.AAC.1